LIESAGCRLICLPTYSPDLNPIEQWWSALKARIRRLRKWAKLTISEALAYLLKNTYLGIVVKKPRFTKNEMKKNAAYLSRNLKV